MKKFLFIFTCVISLFIFTPNVFAYNSFTQYVNLITANDHDLIDEIYRGNDDTLNNYIVGNYNNNDFYTYYDKVKQSVATAKGYTDFSSFTEDYYYLAHFQLIVSSSSGTVYSNPSLSINFYVIRKNSSDLSNFKLLYGVSSLNGGTLNTSNSFRNYLQMERGTYENRYGFQESINNLSSSNGSITAAAGYQYFFDCVFNIGSDVNTCKFTISNNNLNLNIANRLNGGLLYYYDSNFDFDFYFGVLPTAYNYSNYYWFEKLKINGGDTIFQLNDIVAAVPNSDIPISNVTNFGNNSFGVNVNYVDNVVSSLDSNFTSFDYICPNDRQFINGVCNIYFSDFTDFNTNFTNFYNQAIFVVGASPDSLVLKSNKYYILSFRLYTTYNLDIDSLVFTLTGGVGNVGVNDIYKIVVNDYTFYKDYQIIFDMPSNINNNIYGFSLKFKDLSTLTSSVDSGYSFGIYKSFKLSEFDSLPTSSVISSDYSNNGIDSISNSNSTSYFSDFKLNDFGLSSVILMPLNYVRNLPNLVCSSLSLPVPKIGNVTLPCISSFMSSNFGVIWSLYKLIINGLICYKIIINLFATIKNIYKPDNTKI